MGTVTAKNDALTAVGQSLLNNLNTLLDELVAAAPTLPGYESLPPETFRPGAEMFLRWVIEQALVEQRLPDVSDRDFILRGFEARSRVVGIGSVVSVFQVTFTLLCDVTFDTGRSLELSSGDWIALTKQLNLWERSLYTVALELGLEITRAEVTRDHQRKTRLLQDLLVDGGDESLFLGAGLTTAPELHVARIRSTSAGAVEALAADVETWARADAHVVLAGMFEGDLVIISDSAFAIGVDECTGGTAQCLVAAQLPIAFRSATRALQTACALGLNGLHTEMTLGPKPAVVNDHDTGQRLAARYLTPLAPLGAFGDELITTLRAYVANDLRLDRTAAALFVHRSTLKYRLRRYEEVTGVDLATVDDTVGLWWALTWSTAQTV